MTPSNPIANYPEFLRSTLGQQYSSMVAGNAYTERVAKIRLLTERTLDPIRRREGLADVTRMPRGGTKLNPIGNLALPANNTTNNVILAYHVPVGHYGFLNFIAHGYSGQGFREGSGDLTWRIWFGPSNMVVTSAYPFYQYGNMINSLGSLQNPQWAVGGGLPIRENQWIVYTVDVAAGATVTPGGWIFALIEGWIAPI